MPNNTENVLRVTGPEVDLAAFEMACRGRSPKYAPSGMPFEDDAVEPECCLTFSGICPPPAEVTAQKYDRSGYDWQSANWGTKWVRIRTAAVVPPRQRASLHVHNGMARAEAVASRSSPALSQSRIRAVRPRRVPVVPVDRGRARRRRAPLGRVLRRDGQVRIPHPLRSPER